MAKIEMNGKCNKQPESRIPIPSPAPLRRSGSLRLGTCPPIQEHRSDITSRPKLNRHRSLQSLNTTPTFGYEHDDDDDSVRSFSSTASVCSNVSQCDHANFARNGTTYSGRCKRYVVHCSPHSTETDDYLTPTQRTNRTIRKLRSLLKDAQAELIEKDKEILRLTKEVVELRLLKINSGSESNGIDSDARLEHSPGSSAQSDNRSTQSDQLTTSPHPRYCSSPPLAHSLSDSGHFEDLNSSKEINHTAQRHVNQITTLETLQRRYEDEIRELKERHNDKVDSLLQRITDVNDRYYALRPLYEDCKEKLHELEKLTEELKDGPHQSYLTKITEVENLNKELLRDKETLVVEMNNLKQINAELQVFKLNHDNLEIENVHLKNKEQELMIILSNLKEEKCKSSSNDNSFLLDRSSQTEEVQLQNECNSQLVTSQSANKCENKNCSYKVENLELKSQIVAHIEKIKQLQNEVPNEKDIYVQLYKKGIQAAKLLDNEEIETEQNQDKESSLIPDLLQKLRVKQEELDNIKDKDYISPDNLLSAKEAVSLWSLARQVCMPHCHLCLHDHHLAAHLQPATQLSPSGAMYRRLLDTRKEQPKHDPEMTLQFLKSAFYYFLTDRENAPGHLSAIESILGFTDNEKINIERAFLWR